MKSDKLPAMQVYPGDWRKDLGVQALGYHDRGVWWEMLCLMFESADRGKLLLNGNPMPDAAIAQTLGMDNQIFNQTLTTLLAYGVASRDPDTGVIYSRRMVRDEQLRRIRKECGKLGGNPNLVNQIPTTQDKVFPTPSSSSSSSSSDQEKEKEYTLIPMPSAEDQEEPPPPPKPPAPKPAQEPPAEFETARKLFPGDKNGSKVEWVNFQKAVKKLGFKTQDVIPLLVPAIKAEMVDKFRRQKAKTFCPEWAMFSTWVNQGRWTQELAAPPGAAPGPATPGRVPYDPLRP